MTGCIANSQNIERQGERENIKVKIFKVMIEDRHKRPDKGTKAENLVLDPHTIDTHVTTEIAEVIAVVIGTTRTVNHVAAGTIMKINPIVGEGAVVLDQRVQMLLIDQVISRHTNSTKAAVAGAEKVTGTKVIEKETVEITTEVAEVTIDVVETENMIESIIVEAVTAETEIIKLLKTMAKEWLA